MRRSCQGRRNDCVHKPTFLRQYSNQLQQVVVQPPIREQPPPSSKTHLWPLSLAEYQSLCFIGCIFKLTIHQMLFLIITVCVFWIVIYPYGVPLGHGPWFFEPPSSRPPSFPSIAMHFLLHLSYIHTIPDLPCFGWWQTILKGIAIPKMTNIWLVTVMVWKLTKGKGTARGVTPWPPVTGTIGGPTVRSVHGPTRLSPYNVVSPS